MGGGRGGTVCKDGAVDAQRDVVNNTFRHNPVYRLICRLRSEDLRCTRKHIEHVGERRRTCTQPGLELRACTHLIVFILHVDAVLVEYTHTLAVNPAPNLWRPAQQPQSER